MKGRHWASNARVEFESCLSLLSLYPPSDSLMEQNEPTQRKDIDMLQLRPAPLLASTIIGTILKFFIQRRRLRNRPRYTQMVDHCLSTWTTCVEKFQEKTSLMETQQSGTSQKRVKGRTTLPTTLREQLGTCDRRRAQFFDVRADDRRLVSRSGRRAYRIWRRRQTMDATVRFGDNVDFNATRHQFTTREKAWQKDEC